MKKLIKNARLLDMVSDSPNIRNVDILIKDNIIVKIDKEIQENVEELIDAKNMIVMPGLINTHTHIGMSIFRGYKDDKKLMDWLETSIFPIENKLTPEDIYLFSKISCVEMIKTGTTTFNDMYFKMDKVIQAIEETGLRALVSWSVTDDSIRDKYEKTIEYAKKYNIKTSKIKVIVSIHAGYSCNPQTIEKFVKLAKIINVPIHIHLAETLEENEIILKKYNKTPIKYLEDLKVFEVPTILAHGVHLSNKDIEFLKTKKTGIAHNPISNCKLASGICNVVDLRKNNINVGLGTDGQGSTTTLDMFEEMKVAAYLQKIKNMDASCIKAYDILKMATIEGAKALGLENEIGTIEEGKKADLIFININKIHLFPENDICTNLVYSANGADVDTVIVDGKVLMQNRKLINIDENKIIDNYRKSIQRML